jgi:hypothetical protein
MGLPEPTKVERFERIAWGAALALYAGALLTAGLSRHGAIADEAWIGFGVCRELLQGTTEGRQALVSSVWWPPIQSLLRLPFVWMSGLLTAWVALLALGVIGAVCVPLVVERALRRWNAGMSRYVFAVISAADPDLVRWAIAGSAAPAVLAIGLATFYGVVQWARTRGTGSLAYAAIGSAVMVGMGAEAALWAVVAMALVLIDALVRPAARGQRQAIAVMAAVPVLYSVGLLVLMNWLIMGDGLYFLRSVKAAVDPSRDFGAMTLRHGIAAGVLLVSALAGFVLRDRGAAVAGAAGLAFPAVATFLAVRGFLWEPSVAVLAMGPVAAMAGGYLVGTRRAGWVAAPVLAVAVALVAAMGWRGGTALPGVRGDGDERAIQLAHRIERYVLTQSRYAKVFVCGYDAFELAGAGESTVFVPCLDFNLSAGRRDYHGHKLYLLVHEPKGRSAMDSIHWRFEDVYRLGIGGTLYDSDWGPWRLFEIVEAPTRAPLRPKR